MARGRKRKPRAHKLLAGNPGKRPINHAEPQYNAPKEYESPKWLDFTAQRMWDELAPKLVATGVLKETDLHNLEVFCKAYSRWRLAEDEIKKYGITVLDNNNSLKKNPACTVANESLKQLDSFGAKLGLDPSNRTRLMGDTPGQKKNAFNEL